MKDAGSLVGRASELGAAYRNRTDDLRITRVFPWVVRGSKPAQASCSQVAAGGDRWLLMAVRGHLGDTRLDGSNSGCGVPRAGAGKILPRPRRTQGGGKTGAASP